MMNIMQMNMLGARMVMRQGAPALGRRMLWQGTDRESPRMLRGGSGIADGMRASSISAYGQRRSASVDQGPGPTARRTPIASNGSTPAPNESSSTAGTSAVPPERRRRRVPRKAPITLTPLAVDHIKQLLGGPNPRLLRISVESKGCAGSSYQLNYVTEPGKFDEVVEQDGVKVLVDSKALFSILGSQMDWRESDLGSRFVFDNPNIKSACGCGESFHV